MIVYQSFITFVYNIKKMFAEYYMKGINIKDISGKLKFSTPINKGAKGKFMLMKEDYIILPFSVPTPIPFKLGDWTDLTNVLDESLGGLISKRYEIIDIQAPTYNSTTGGYDYQLRLDAYYWKWKNKKFKYSPEYAGTETSWSLTASLDIQLGVFLRNLKALGYTYNGKDFEFSIDSTVENKAIAMTYDNINLLDALFSMASETKWNCDCWITDNIIHFGRNEYGDSVNIELGVEASTMTRSESKGTFATRIYAFGSTRNIPTNYRPTSEQPVVNGVVQKRLMLPADTPYIDAYENMTQEEAVEDVVIFDNIFPKRIGSLSDVHTRTQEIENEDGKKETISFYRYKDTGLKFKNEYLLEGKELKIQFTSGKLNGLEFGVIFNPEPKDENRGEQLWEIVRNEDYGRFLPDDTLFPENGDKYILTGFNIGLVSDQYVHEAELELKEKAIECANKRKKDDGTYNITLDSSWVYNDKIKRFYRFGQKVHLVNKAFFENGRNSRILGWELNLDIPWDSPIYIAGESSPYSRISDIEEQVESLIYKGKEYVGNGDGVYLIRINDTTAPSDSNAFSALRSLMTFLRKDREDATDFLLRLLGGVEIGESVDSMLAGKGIIADTNGRMQMDRLELRSSLLVKELIVNRWFPQEGNVTYSEAGTIDKVERMDDGSYTLTIRRRWEFDVTAFDEQDVAFGSINDLAQGGGLYYDAWFRVLSVNRTANTLSVLPYPDNEVPGGKNYVPSVGMVVTRRGNATNTERQGFWYLSSYEGCICFLDGVTKPILETRNYSIIIGKLKRLELFDNLPINYLQSYVYCRGIVTQDLLRVDYEGVPVVQLNDRGNWEMAVATGENPYRVTDNAVDSVWHYGCRWRCLVDKTTDEPRYASTGWAMIEGNPNFYIDILSSGGWGIDDSQLIDGVPFTTLSVVGTLYNREVTEHLLDADVSWTRDTGNVAEDNAWAIKKADAGKSLPLMPEDLGLDFARRGVCSFKCTAVLRDGKETKIDDMVINF